MKSINMAQVTEWKVNPVYVRYFGHYTKGDMRMHKRKLQELNLLDDFLMFTLVNHQKYGEDFSRELLRIILGKVFKKLKVIPQKVYYGSDTDKHGARLDVYLEEELDDETWQENATICDVEPNLDNSAEHIESLPRKMRFYHSKIDAGSFESGADYQDLKKVIVIMITPYDPFGLNRMIYTVGNRCLEEPDMPYDDGAKTLFLYTKGTEGNPTEELRELLRYMENTEAKNAQSDALKEIHHMVEEVKQDSEVSLGYMRMMRSQEELTKKEKRRADEAEKRADEAEKKTKEVEKKAKEKIKAVEAERDELRKELECLKNISKNQGQSII